jgi:hypothetical protein
MLHVPNENGSAYFFFLLQEVTSEREQQIIEVDPIEDIIAGVSGRRADAVKKVQTAPTMGRMENPASSKRQWKNIETTAALPKRSGKGPKVVATQRHYRKVRFDDGFLESELHVSPKPLKRKKPRKLKTSNTKRELTLGHGRLPSPPSHVNNTVERKPILKVTEEPIFQYPIVYDMTTDTTTSNTDDSVPPRTGLMDNPEAHLTNIAFDTEPADEAVYYQFSAITAPPRRGSDSGSDEDDDAQRSQTDWDDYPL